LRLNISFWFKINKYDTELYKEAKMGKGGACTK
jgi:hypothetical protein